MRGERPEDGTGWKSVVESMRDQRTFVAVSVHPETHAIEVDCSSCSDLTLLMGLLQQAQWVIMQEHRQPTGACECH